MAEGLIVSCVPTTYKSYTVYVICKNCLFCKILPVNLWISRSAILVMFPASH